MDGYAPGSRQADDGRLVSFVERKGEADGGSVSWPAARGQLRDRLEVGAGRVPVVLGVLGAMTGGDGVASQLAGH